MKRPSYYLLMFSLLFIAGYLAIDQWLPVSPAKPAGVGPSNKEPVVLKAAPSPRSRQVTAIKGRVFDPRGFLVVGAEIALGSGEHGRTDGDGAFQLDTPAPPPWDMTVAASGFRRHQQRLFPSVGDPLFLTLETEAPWDVAVAASEPAPLPALVGDGFVIDGDGKGVANAMVAVVGTELRARTDDIGHYRIPLPGPGTELVVSQPETGLCCRSEVLPLADGKAPLSKKGMVPLPDLVPKPGAAIRGTIRDPKGVPVEGVPMQLRGVGLVRSLESGRDGMFRISGLIAGSYELVAMAWRGTFGSSQQVRVDASVVDCDLHLTAAEERRMRVVDAGGQPVARAYVATSVAGRRSEVVRADDQGWVELAMAKGTSDFEVRGDDLRQWCVKHGDGDQLVVALP
jgi:hypothetical protein